MRHSLETLRGPRVCGSAGRGLSAATRAAHRMDAKIAPINAPWPGSEPRKRHENVAG